MREWRVLVLTMLRSPLLTLSVSVLVLVLVFAATSLALDPARATSQYVVTRWGAGDLSSGAVHAALQGRDGYLWLGTAAGLVRFDGARFVLFDMDHGALELEDGGVASLSEGADGALYVGTMTGSVVRYAGGVFTRVAIPQAGGAVHAVLPRPDGSLWVLAHARPLYQFKDGRGEVKRCRFADGRDDNLDAPLGAAQEASGTAYVGTAAAGLFRVSGETAQRLGFVGETVQAVHFDRRGDLWLGTPHGLVRWRDGVAQRFTTRDGLSNDYVTAIQGDRDGNLWVGTAGGGINRLCRDDTAGAVLRWRISRMGTREGLSNDHVRCLLEDSEGNIWVGTANGLDCLSEGPFITYGALEGVSDPAVTAVVGTPDGSVWLGTNSGGVVRLRGQDLESFRLPAGMGRDAILALGGSGHDGVWVVVDDGRVFRLSGGRLQEHTPDARGLSEKVRLVLEDERGPIFFIRGLGPVRPLQGRLVPLLENAPRVATGTHFHAAYRDPSGTLWVGTTYGLLRIRDREGRMLGVNDGLPSARVRWIAGDPGGGLWLATPGGLARVEGETVRAVTKAQGLPENYLLLVLDDGRGSLWIASMSRIFRIDKRQIQDLFAGKIARVSPVLFDTWDGLRATEPASLGNSPGFVAPDGRLWFATAQGASVIDPARVPAEDLAPRVMVEHMKVDGRSGVASEYPPGRGEVTIDFAALAFRAPAKLSFRYRLQGFDADWVDCGSRRTAYYSNLPAGRYRFFVTASNRHHVWNGAPTVIDFRLRPPFHRTPLFFVLSVAAVLGLAGAAYRLRVRTMHARLTATIHERTRIARELHDTLAQGLAGIGLQLHAAMILLPNLPGLEGTRQQLEQAHSMIKIGLTEIRRSIWVLRAQTAQDARNFAASLEGSLAQLTAESKTASAFEVLGEPRPLSPELERNLLRIAHEAVSNAAHHAGAREINVVLQFEADHVRLRVRDDGGGFDVEAAQKRSGGEHFGLLGMSERARSLGGTLSLASQDGQGTEVDCRLPYDHAEGPATRGAPS